MSNDEKLTYKEFVEKYLPTKSSLDNLSDKTKAMVEEAIEEVKRVSKKVFEEDSNMTPKELIDRTCRRLSNHTSVKEVTVTTDRNTGDIRVNVIMRKI